MYRVSRFCFHILLAFVGTLAVVQVIEALPGLDAGISVFITLPLLIAAMLEGKHFVRMRKEGPTEGQCWKAAFCMGIITGGLTVAGLLIYRMLLPPPTVTVPGYEIATDWLTIFICAAVAVPMLRIGYAIGVTSELRANQLSKH